jgi:hypothetical protein
VAQIAADEGVHPGDIEIWFADEARIGQKNKITRRWAKRGTRPSAPHDQRTASTYIFGAICPKEGKGAALVLPTCNTEAMNLHLAAPIHRERCFSEIFIRRDFGRGSSFGYFTA